MLNAKLYLICCLVLLLSACKSKQEDSLQSTNFEKQTTQNGLKAKASSTAISGVIPEQDPRGIFWGVRDTISGKLILDYTYTRIFDFEEGYAIVIKDNKCGMINKRGKQIIEPIYDSPESQLQCGIIAFKYYSTLLAFDTTGKVKMSRLWRMLPCQDRFIDGGTLKNLRGDTILGYNGFTRMRLVPEGLLIAYKSYKPGRELAGLYDFNGKQLLPHVFESIGDFFCGRAIVKKEGKYGVIDETGKELFYTEYTRMDSYYNNHSLVYKSSLDNQVIIGIIDRNGQEIVPTTYQWFERFNFNEGMVAIAKNGKYGFIDTTGNVVIPFKYDMVESFKSGIAKVWVGSNQNYSGYINKKGEEIISPDFRAIRRYHEYYNTKHKYIIGIKDSVQHVFDYSGKKIATLPYQSIVEFGEYFIVSLNKKYGVLDSMLQVKIPIEYESLRAVLSNRIVASKKEKLGLIDYNGKVILPFKYDWLNEFFNGKIAGGKNGKIGFFDRNGKALSPFLFDELLETDNTWYIDKGLAKVLINGKKGVINSHTILIVPAIYDEIGDFSYGLAVVKRNNKYGFVNLKGREVISPRFDEASPYGGYAAEVTLKGEIFQIDSLGNRLEDEDYNN